MRALSAALEDMQESEVYGRVVAVRGLLIEIAGPLSQMKVGGRLAIETLAPEPVLCEIVGFESRHALAMPFADSKA